MEAWQQYRERLEEKYQIQGTSYTYDKFGQEKHTFSLSLPQYIYVNIIYKHKHTFLTKNYVTNLLSCLKLIAQKYSGCTTSC